MKMSTMRHVYGQKLIKIYDSNKAEEKQIKEHVEKWKIKRRGVAEKIYFKKEKARGKQRNWKRTMDKAKCIEQWVQRH